MLRALGDQEGSFPRDKKREEMNQDNAAGLTFHDPLAIFTIKLLQQSRLALSRTSSLFP
jgi:hypothetical protein